MRLRWLLVGFVAVLAACAAPSGNPVPKTWVADPNNGELVVYRTDSFIARARNTYFYLDGVHVATLGPATYTVVKIPPGSSRLSLKWDWDMMVKETVIDIPIAPRQKHYVRLRQSGSNTTYSSPAVIQFGWQLAVVGADVAHTEMQSLEEKPAINTAPH